jgi:hypothetical protein
MVDPSRVRISYVVSAATHGLHPWLLLGRPSGTIRATIKGDANSRAMKSAELSEQSIV